MHESQSLLIKNRDKSSTNANYTFCQLQIKTCSEEYVLQLNMY